MDLKTLTISTPSLRLDGKAPTTDLATNLAPSAEPASGSVSSTSEPGPIRRKPMARLSASSKLRSANGPMPRPISAQIIVAQSFPSGCTATIGTDPRQYRCQTAHQQTRSNREQPVEAPQLGHLLQLRPRLPRVPALLKLCLRLFQGGPAIRARHRAVDGHRPEPAQTVGTAAGLVDAADLPRAAADSVVRTVLIDPGAERSGVA